MKLNNKKILLVCQTGGYLLVDIARAFQESGKYEKVAVLTGVPAIFERTKIPGLEVESMTPYSTASEKARLFAWVKGFFDIIRIVKQKYKDYELFLFSNPGTVAFLHRFCKNKYMTLTWDLFPDGFYSSGLMSNKNIIYKIWARENKTFYSKAESVFCITEQMAEAMDIYYPKEKIKVVPLWANESVKVVNVDKNQNPFRLSNRLIDKFVIQYSGNIGKDHSLGTVIEAAVRLKDYNDIIFLFIGEGLSKSSLQKKAEECGVIDKCLFLPFQPLDMLPFSLSSPDIAMVSINEVSVSIPSKTFDLMRMGRPLLCIADARSGISQFIKENGLGESFNKFQADEVAAFIIDMYQNPTKLKKYHDNALQCADIYTRENQAIKFLY